MRFGPWAKDTMHLLVELESSLNLAQDLFNPLSVSEVRGPFQTIDANSLLLGWGKVYRT